MGSDPHPAVIPATIAHYRIIRKLSSGGMGDVYLAEDPKLGRKVALKVLQAQAGEEGGSAGPARLVKEARAAAKLDHPNVCQIFEVGESDSGPYIAMQYVEGETLASVIRRSRPRLEEILSWGIQVCDALTEAHSQGIVHRDIKPANLMLTPKGQVKVLDFGLAKVTSKSTKPAEDSLLLTTPGLVMGTVPYMSPEQVRGDSLDGRSDLFSLGSILFEAATGQRPFGATHSADLMSQILLVNPFGDGVSDAIHPDLRVILRRVMEKDRNRRTSTAQAFGEELRALYTRVRGGSGPLTWPSAENSGPTTPVSLHPGDLPTSVHPSAATPAPARPRWHAWAAGLGAVAVLVPAALYAVPKFLAANRTIDSIAVLPIANSANDPELDYLCDGLTEQLINQLSRLPNVKVIARSSVLRYKGQTPDLRTLAKELGVKAVLVGRMMQRDGKLTLSAELAETGGNRHLWGDQFVRPTAELADLQDRLALDISRTLKGTLNPADQRALAPGHSPVDPEAYRLYLKGRFYQDKWTPPDFQRALALYDQALEKDPTFAAAPAAKALAYWNVSSQFMPPAEAMAQVRIEAQKALAIQPNHPDALAAMGGVQAVLDYDFQASEASFKRSLELDPNNVTTLMYYTYILVSRGRTREAIDMGERARQLDPMSPMPELFLGWAYWWSPAPDLDKAITHFQAALTHDPDFWYAQLSLGYCLDLKGRRSEAEPHLAKAYASGGSWALGYKGFRLARAGDRAGAQHILDELLTRKKSDSGYASPHAIALIYEGLGDTAKALDWMESSYLGREEVLMFLAYCPDFSTLRSEPRFKALAERVHAVPAPK